MVILPKPLLVVQSMVMAGSLFAGYDQSAGNIIEVTLDGRSLPRAYKEYYGSASQYNKGEYKTSKVKKNFD